MMYNPYMIGMAPQMASNPQFNQMGYNYQPQQMQAVQPNPTASIMVAQVPTVEHVEQVQMNPGDRKIVLVQNNPDFIAIRVADNAGFVSTEYRMSHVVDPKTLQAQPQYAPVQAVLELKNEIDEIKKSLGGVINAKPNPQPVNGAE